MNCCRAYSCETIYWYSCCSRAFSYSFYFSRDSCFSSLWRSYTWLRTCCCLSFISRRWRFSSSIYLLTWLIFSISICRSRSFCAWINRVFCCCSWMLNLLHSEIWRRTCSFLFSSNYSFCSILVSCVFNSSTSCCLLSTWTLFYYWTIWSNCSL